MESDKTLTQLDLYLFGNGTHYEIYEKMGAHPMTLEGRQGVYFSVWAPHAQKVSVVGDFNQWNPKSNEMKPQGRHYFKSGSLRLLF